MPQLTWLAGDGFAAGALTNEPLVQAEYVEGKIIFTLTEAGKAFLADPDHGHREFLEAIYQVKDPATGNSYNVQVVVPRDPSFDSSKLNGVETEHSQAVDESDLIRGEWHQGDSSSSSAYDVVGSNLGDEFVFNGDLSGADIRTGYDQSGNWGDDTLTVNGTLRAASGANNSITGGNGADRFDIGGAHATGSGWNHIDSGAGRNDQLNIASSDVSGYAYSAGLFANGSLSGNRLSTEGEVRISASTDSGMTYGVMSANKGRNEINGGSIEISAASSGTHATGVTAQSGGFVKLSLDDNSGTVNLRAGSQSGNQTNTALHLHSGGNLEVDGNLKLTAQSGAGHAYALRSGGSGVNTIKVNGVIDGSANTYNADNASGKIAAEGLVMANGGTLNIDADGINLQAHSSDGLGYGIYSEGATLNIVSQDADLNVDSYGRNSSRGIYNKTGATAINAGNINLNVGSASVAYGMLSMDGQLTVNAAGFNLSAESDGQAYGLRAYGIADQELNADSVFLSVEGGNTVSGLEAYARTSDITGASVGQASNIVSTGLLEMNVNTTGNAMATGMYARTQGDAGQEAVNRVQAEQNGAITVIITVKSGNANNAYAMLTDANNSRNEILGGNGSDFVSLEGRIKGDNLIDTGQGDDIIRLNGKVEGLLLRGGEGYDQLILQAGSVVEFNTFYRSWLSGMSPAELQAMGIESIRVSIEGADGQSAPELAWLTALVDGYNAAYGTNGNVTPGEDIDLSYAAAADDGHNLQGFAAHDGYDLNLGGAEVAAQASLPLQDGDDFLNLDGLLSADPGSGAGNDAIFLPGGPAGADLGSRPADADLGAGQDADVLRVYGDLTGHSGISQGDGNEWPIIHGSLAAAGRIDGGGLEPINPDGINPDGIKLDGIKLDGLGDSLPLAELAGNSRAFEVIDLSGRNDNELSIDTLLDGLNIEHGLNVPDIPVMGRGADLADSIATGEALGIAGDNPDKVSMGEARSDSLGQAGYGEQVYDVHQGADNEYLLLQQIIQVGGI